MAVLGYALRAPAKYRYDNSRSNKVIRHVAGQIEMIAAHLEIGEDVLLLEVNATELSVAPDGREFVYTKDFDRGNPFVIDGYR